MAHTFILFDKGKKDELGRLHVGFRAADWTKVWYEPDPDGNEDPDGFVGPKLYKLSSGAEQRREPMFGEVVWLPHFNIKHFASGQKREKERLHAQYLHDAWRYLSETNPDQVRQLEEELDDPKYRHWQGWFDEAKKWKSSRLRQRVKRRRSREAAAQSAGINVREVEVTSDTSDDSTYESDEDPFIRDKSTRHPPPRASTKRKAGGGGGGPPRKKSPNKSKSSPGDKSHHRSRVDDQDLPMSGGLGNMGGAGSFGEQRPHGGPLFRSTFSSRINIPGLDDGEDRSDNAALASDYSNLFDSRSPERGLPRRPASRTGGASKLSSSAQREAGQARMRDQFRQAAAAGPGAEAARALAHNAGMEEEAAVERALRESTQDAEARRNSDRTNIRIGENGPVENGPVENRPVENRPVENRPVENEG
ncbi:hypothetical protein DOTSEDRAFT_51443 [Dothistroma septosporum NZE10]|uniref:Uncharacterized protein n=1 Tax=Dothistroma septosporum (strain NZE10 / CBS 128990) TaxID=675120 RepID=N1Q0S7_DOTSN|nr:hypothetical protein DOTSEDRAFT_51443 [Dothistroma septosporum NZE10]